MSLNQIAQEVHQTALNSGFWDHDMIRVGEQSTIFVKNPSIDSEKLFLCSSELVEALDSLRDGDMEHVTEELADCIIRVLDYCAARDLDIDQAITNKMAVNKIRPRLHGRNF